MDRGLVFHQRPLRWRLRGGDLVLFLDLPGAGGEPCFELLARFFPGEETRSSSRCPLDDADLALVAADLRGARLMRARVGHEFSRFLPRPPVYVTVLRDPTERIVALYEEARLTPGHPHHDPIASGRLSLRDFVENPAFAHEVVDAQARRIAGAVSPGAGWPDSVLLEVAQANLGEFAFFGLADRTSQSRLLLAYTFGRPFPPDLGPAAGPAVDAAVLDRVDAATREAIEARTRVDAALVRFAREQLDLRIRAALADLLEQNGRQADRYLLVLAENERLRVHEASIRESWSWRTAERLRAWRQAVLPPGSRGEGLYQRLGALVFRRRGSAP